MEKKITEQFKFLVKRLTDNKSTLNVSTHNTSHKQYMGFSGNDPLATILAFSPLSNSIGDNEYVLFLCKNNLGDEEMWSVAPLSIIQLQETTLDKPGFDVAA